jgi:catechol 2,3-dioxygenase-like lactoylglutathione lyase family enzyme
MAIIGAHTIIYAHDAEAARAFFRDVLGLPHVAAGGGWLIFRSPPAEVAVHPVADAAEDARHELYLMCDDIQATMTDLRAKGVQFDGEPQDLRWGLLASMQVPGAGTVGLYQPMHPMALDLPDSLPG